MYSDNIVIYSVELNERGCVVGVIHNQQANESRFIKKDTAMYK